MSAPRLLTYATLAVPQVADTRSLREWTSGARSAGVKVIALSAPERGQAKRLGFLQGQLDVPDDFDRMGGTEIEALFGTKP